MAKLSLAKLERHLYSAADRLRQEGLDAATYKDYIFGMLFLKRCSDVFDAEREKIVGRKVEQGMIKEVAETQYGENPDYYDGFFVPERARWAYLQAKLNDATEPYGSVLDKALGALSEANESLEHVLDHISFMRMQSNKRIVSDDACKDLVRHFSRVPPAQRGLPVLRPARRGLRVPHQHVRRVGGQEGRRLLHPARCHPPHGAHPQAPAGAERL